MAEHCGIRQPRMLLLDRNSYRGRAGLSHQAGSRGEFPYPVDPHIMSHINFNNVVYRECGLECWWGRCFKL